jgi:bloom syndrome protein
VHDSFDSFQRDDVNLLKKISLVAKNMFGVDKFRPLQLRAILAAAKGQDVFLVLPTGGGKTMCFLLPAVLDALNGKVSVVFAPLIALQNQHVHKALHLYNIT